MKLRSRHPNLCALFTIDLLLRAKNSSLVNKICMPGHLEAVPQTPYVPQIAAMTLAVRSVNRVLGRSLMGANASNAIATVFRVCQGLDACSAHMVATWCDAKVELYVVLLAQLESGKLSAAIKAQALQICCN